MFIMFSNIHNFMGYEGLEANLMAISSEGHLYGRFHSATVSYLDAVSRLGQAEASRSPQTTQLRENVDGRFRELSEVVAQVNLGFQSHQPPLPVLPTRRQELTQLAIEYLGNTFTSRVR